ncbi:MAG: electron transport protein SCO1/SenC [Marmoricola sp.]|nr:electron transport protein SCO1/SenC [Marmoricola sp.]
MRRPYALVLLAPLVLVLAACGGQTSAGPAAPGNNVGTQLSSAVPASILNLPLTDSTGKTVHLADFSTKVLVISDSMTLCQETCPLDTASIVASSRAVNAAGYGKDVQFLTITVDPERDTPTRLAAYRKLYDGPANWSTLTGSAKDVHRLWKYFGVYWKKVPDGVPAPKDWLTGTPLTFDIEHSDEVFFLHRGTEKFVLDGVPHITGGLIPSKLRSFLSASGRKNVDHPSKLAWTIPQALQVVGWLVGHPMKSPTS